MWFQVNDPRVGYILNKIENVTSELFAIYMQKMHSSKANESISDCSKTGLCIKSMVYGCCPEETHKSKKEGKDQESIQSSPHMTQDTNWKVTT